MGSKSHVNAALPATEINYSDFVNGLKNKTPTHILNSKYTLLQHQNCSVHLQKTRQLFFKTTYKYNSSLQKSNQPTQMSSTIKDSPNVSVITTCDNLIMKKIFSQAMIESCNCESTYLKPIFSKDAPIFISSSFQPLMWTDIYSPSILSEMLGESNEEISKLKSWIYMWSFNNKVIKSFNEDSNSLIKRSKIQTPILVESDESCDSIDGNHQSRNSAYLIIGPTGCGKTSLVYALANQYGFKVFELNASNCRSRKEILSQCTAVVGSQHVSKETLSSAFSSFEMAKQEVTQTKPRKQSSKRSLANFFQPADKRSTPSKNKPSEKRNRKGEISKEGLSLNNQSLLLFDEVDLLLESDKGFWSAIDTLLQVGKRPILLTSSDPSIVHRIPVSFSVCNIKPALTTDIVSLLEKICEKENQNFFKHYSINFSSINHGMEINHLKSVEWTSRQIAKFQTVIDIRQLINQLQFGCLQNASIICSSDGLEYANHWPDDQTDMLIYLKYKFPKLFSVGFASETATNLSPFQHSCLASKPECSLNTKDDLMDIFDDEDKLVSTQISSANQLVNLSKDENNHSKKYAPLFLQVLQRLSKISESQSLIDTCSTLITLRSSKNACRISNEAFLLKAEKSATPSNNLTSTLTSLSISMITEDSCETDFFVPQTGECFAEDNIWRHSCQKFVGDEFESAENEIANLRDDSKHFYPENMTDQKTKKDAANTLFSVDYLKNSQNLLLKRELALDYLPNLRTIHRGEMIRQSLLTKRRFHHYFEKIGFFIPDKFTSCL